MQNKHGKTIRRKHRKCQVWGWFGKGFGRGLGGFGKYKNMLEKKLRKRMMMPPATVCCSWALPIKGGTALEASPFNIRNGESQGCEKVL